MALGPDSYRVITSSQGQGADVVGQTKVLAVTFLAGVTPECGDPGGVRVDKDETSVRLTAEVVYRDVPLSGKFCPAAGKIATRDVRLAEPLGDRAVIDTSREGTEEPVQVVRS